MLTSEKVDFDVKKKKKKTKDVIMMKGSVHPEMENL